MGDSFWSNTEVVDSKIQQMESSHPKRRLSSSSEAGPSRPTAHLSTSFAENPPSFNHPQISTYKPKRKRISPAQLEALAAAFALSDTPLYDVREELADRLGMSNREVQVWFQNRRAKMARLRARAQAPDDPSNPDEALMEHDPTVPSSSTEHSGAPRPSIQRKISHPPLAQSSDSHRNPTNVSPLRMDTGYRDVDTHLLPPSTAGSVHSVGSMPSVHVLAEDGSDSQYSNIRSKASATASWLSSISQQSSSYSPSSAFTTLSSGGTTLSSGGYSNSPAPSECYLSVRSAPTRLGGSSASSSSGGAPGNYFLGPAPVLPPPQTDFLNLSLQKAGGKPLLPLPSVPTSLSHPTASSSSTSSQADHHHHHQPPLPTHQRRRSSPRDQQPIPSSSASATSTATITSNWYHAWPKQGLTIAAPPHLTPRWGREVDGEDEIMNRRSPEGVRRW